MVGNESQRTLVGQGAASTKASTTLLAAALPDAVFQRVTPHEIAPTVLHQLGFLACFFIFVTDVCPALTMAIEGELPGRPMRAWAATQIMLTVGGAAGLIFILIPPLAASTVQQPVGGPQNIWAAVDGWMAVLEPLADKSAVMLSAFAVLLLTLFVEESIRATDTVPVATRRNIANFALIGGILTVALAFVAVGSISFGGDIGAGAQAAGSAAVAVFFASHIATRSVKDVTRQERYLKTKLRQSKVALASLGRRRRMSVGSARILLIVGATVVWLLLPAALSLVAWTVTSQPAWSAVVLAVYAAMMYPASMTVLAVGLTLPDNPRVIRVTGRIMWFLMCVGLVVIGSAAYQLEPWWLWLTPSAIAAAIVLASIPSTAMPAWTLTGAVISLQLHQLARSRRATKRDLRRVREWKALAVAEASALPSADRRNGN